MGLSLAGAQNQRSPDLRFVAFQTSWKSSLKFSQGRCLPASQAGQFRDKRGEHIKRCVVALGNCVVWKAHSWEGWLAWGTLCTPVEEAGVPGLILECGGI